MKGNRLKRSSKPSGKSEAWRSRDRKVLWHPFTQQKLWMEEEFPVIASGKGATLVDLDGRKYLDGVSSLWCNIHGHARREINAAMKKQLDRVAHATFLGLTNPPAIELGEKLVELAPKGLTRVFYSDNGSTAVEVAAAVGVEEGRALPSDDDGEVLLHPQLLLRERVPENLPVPGAPGLRLSGGRRGALQRVSFRAGR